MEDVFLFARNQWVHDDKSQEKNLLAGAAVLGYQRTIFMTKGLEPTAINVFSNTQASPDPEYSCGDTWWCLCVRLQFIPS